MNLWRAVAETVVTLQMFIRIYGIPIGFSAISMVKGCKNHRETLKGKDCVCLPYTASTALNLKDAIFFMIQ